MVKTFFKLALATMLYTILFVLANALLPFSQGFKELGASSDPTALLFILISSAWTCVTLWFIITHTHCTGIKLAAAIFCVIFFVQYFMTQVETLFFGGAFTVLTKSDIVLIMLAGAFPLLGTTPLLVRFFQDKNPVYESVSLNLKTTALRLIAIGVIYLCVYMVFGYFVAWQFTELRLFYSGSTEKLSFLGQLANNIKTNAIIYPFQIIRGILFGAAIFPIRKMMNENKTAFITAVCLIYLCTAVVLIIPNALFPDTVRIGHLIEMTSSMLLFGILAGNVLWETNKKRA
jgi:hypothetical protein